jgi:formate dehydrogenase maturation protein FdhE
MAIGKKDQRVLKALTEAREQHEELADLLDFYHDLYEVQFQAKAEVSEPEVRDELAMHWRLEGGIPQLTFDQLGLEPEPFAQLVARVTDVLLRYNPGWQVDQASWVPEKMITQAQQVFETWDTLTAPKPGSEGVQSDDVWPSHPMALAVGFGLAPHLQRASDVILPGLDLASWGRGYCPVCGGRPNFALLDEESGARKLMCSRCASLWPYSRLDCPFCITEERPAYYPSEDGLHRLYVCPACKRYLKTVDMRKARQVVHPMVERLLTVGMDLAAREEGYEG